MDKRVEIANKMIKIISSYGRRFFYNKSDGAVAFFVIKNKRIYFVDDYTKKEIYLHYRYWNKGFLHGGTLRHLVNHLKNYIQGRSELPLNHLGPWPQTMCDGDLWGYGESMEQVRKECNLLNQ